MTRTRGWIPAAALAAAVACPAARALDTQVHGFIAQGALYSGGNELFGESTEGSIEYFEGGLTGAIDAGHGLRGSAQLVTRRAGENDEGKPRLDFGFVDYRPLRGKGANLGLRAGTVKNAWGLYNDSRDVVFTRPGILLPDSLYSDISGQRAVLYSSQGGQLYGDVAWGEQLLSLVVTGARDRRLDEQERRTLIDLGGAPFDVDLRDYWQARLMDEVGGGRWRLALSSLHANIDLDAPAVTVTGDFAVQQYAASVQYNADRFTLTGEYVHARGRNEVFLGGVPLQQSDKLFRGAYLQGEYHFAAAWTALLRVDVMTDRDNGRNCDELSPPVDDHECFSLDTTLGGNWQPRPQWGLWAELHLIDGLLNRISMPDNPDRTHDPHWSVFLLMAAYRF